MRPMLCIVTQKELSNIMRDDKVATARYATNVMYRDSKGDYERYQSYCTKPMLCIVTQKEIMRDIQATARNQCYVS